MKLPDGTVKVLVGRTKRIKILNHNEKNGDYLTCEVELADDQNVTKDSEQYANALVKKFERLQVLNKRF